MNLAIQNAWKHPASTAKGILTFIAGLSLFLGEKSDLVKDIPFISPKVLAVMFSASSAARLILAMMQKDVGREEVKVPGQTGTEMVAAHETPDVSGAKVVTPEAK